MSHVTKSRWLTVFFFPDVVDSCFPEQVDTLLESLTPLLKRLIFAAIEVEKRANLNPIIWQNHFFFVPLHRK